MRELITLLYPEHTYYNVKEPGLLVKIVRKPLSIMYKVFNSSPKETMYALNRYLKGELDSSKYYGSYKR